MTTEQMRQALLRAYSGEGWKKKVLKMPADQIFVVYTRIKNAGKI